MNIQSAQSPAVNGRGPITKAVNLLFKEAAPEGSFADTLQDVYYSRPESSRRLTEVTLQKQQQYHELLDQAVSQGLLSAERAAQREQNFESGAIGPYNAREKTPPGAEVLDILRDMDNEQFCLIRHPQQCGDGLYRPMDFYISPGHLQLKGAAQGWPMSKTSDGQDVPVADVVVIGAGPGGLTTSWQLARRGGRVVNFESELAGSNFNDGGAKSVHHMRTSVDSTNLVNEGNSHATLEHPLSLSGNIAINREHARLGREGQNRLTGETMHGIYDAVTEVRSTPATRGELWDHLSGLAYSLANDFPDAVLCERSPVSSVTWEDGLFTVTSSRGHKVKCKELVLSTGLTGAQGERARMLKVLGDAAQEDPKQSVVIAQVADTQKEAARLEEIATGKSQATLVMNDRLLGDQSLRQTVASLPEGARAAMIGSGESAIKGTLELAHLNPNMKIDLYVKGHLESAQIQVPSEIFHPAVVDNTFGEFERSKKLAEAYKTFDTPVTPRSLQEVFELQQAGRVRIMELGQYFDEKSVAVHQAPEGGMTVTVKDPAVKGLMARNEAHYKAVGLLPADASMTKPTTYNVMVVGAGYNKLHVEDHPLAQLPAEAKEKLHVNTIADAVNPGQTGLPGLGGGGRLLAERLAERLVPEDRRIDLTLPDRGITYRDLDRETVNTVIKSGGLYPEFLAKIQDEIAESGHSKDEIWLSFPTIDSRFRDLAAKNPEALTAPEKEVLARGWELATRLKEWRDKEYAEL
jgi:hypothetical protein